MVLSFWDLHPLQNLSKTWVFENFLCDGPMAKVALLALLLLVSGGIAYLALSEVPAPTKQTEKSIPVERFFK